jgi:DNA-binding transcriptional regulator GbsR (MarR family)
MPKSAYSEAAQVDALADKIGKFIAYWGFKEIQGRIWSYLFLFENPSSAVDLARKLKVSKALISIAMKDLIRFGVIEEAGRGKGRIIFYRANPHFKDAIVNVLKTREKKMISQISHSVSELAKVPAEGRKNLGLDLSHVSELQAAVSLAEGFLDSLISADL